MSTPAKLTLKPKDRLALFTDIATMLKAGISILDAIESLETDARGHLRQVLGILKDTLNNGEALSSGLERLPNAFDTITINLISAAEAGGTLEDTLEDIVASTKQDLAFSQQLRNTLIYPAFVMVVFGGIVILMLSFVIPRVAKVFNGMHMHIPRFTQFMFDASSFFMTHWVFIVAGVLVSVPAIIFIIASQRRRLARTLLSLPILRRLGSNIDLARFCRSFGLLMQAGVPLLEALELSERVVQKKDIREVIETMRTNAEAGKPISDSLRAAHGVVPPIMARSIETAEDAGTLDETLTNLTGYFDNRVNESLKVISSLAEPILLVVVGVLVGLLMITIIAPTYNLISHINASANP